MEHLSNAPWRSEVYERSGQRGVKRQRVASGHGHAEVEDECCAVDDVDRSGSMGHLSIPPWRRQANERSGQKGVKRQRVASGHCHAEVEDKCCAVDGVVLDEDPWKKGP